MVILMGSHWLAKTSSISLGTQQSYISSLCTFVARTSNTFFSFVCKTSMFSLGPQQSYINPFNTCFAFAQTYLSFSMFISILASFNFKSVCQSVCFLVLPLNKQFVSHQPWHPTVLHLPKARLSTLAS